MKKLCISIVAVSFVVAAVGAWGQEAPSKEPYQDLGEAGIVATDAIYPFASLSAMGVSTGTRHSTVGALPNGNFVIITNTMKPDGSDGSNMAAVVLDSEGSIVAGPAPVAYDKDGPLPWQEEGLASGTGDPWLSISRDGSEVAIVFEIQGWEWLNLDHPLYPNDPGGVFLQRLSTTDLSPHGTVVSIFPGSVAAPTPDQTNFGYFPTGYMPNGNIICLARSRDQWDSPIRDTPQGHIETQRIGVMTIVNADATQVVVPPRAEGREYGHDLLANPNQWNAEPSRGVVEYADGCVICYAGPHGWATVDQDGNVGEWHYEGFPYGDGNQGALMSDGKYLLGKTQPSGDYGVWDIQTGENLLSVDVKGWADSAPQRSFGGMNSGGQVFMIWQEHGLFGLKTAAGRFGDADGTLYPDASFVLMEAGTEAGGFIEHSRGQADFGNTHAIYVSHDGERPDLPAGIDDELVARIFENPFQAPSAVGQWELY